MSVVQGNEKINIFRHKHFWRKRNTFVVAWIKRTLCRVSTVCGVILIQVDAAGVGHVPHLARTVLGRRAHLIAERTMHSRHLFIKCKHFSNNFWTASDRVRKRNHDTTQTYPVFERMVAERHDGTLVAFQLRRQVHLVCV